MLSTGSIHFVSPVIDGFLVVDFFPQSMDEGARRPDGATIFLFKQHLIQDRGEPVLKLAVVIVRNNEVANTIHALLPKSSTVQIEVSEVCLSQTLDEVFFDTASSRHNSRDHLVFGKIQDDFSKPG